MARVDKVSVDVDTLKRYRQIRDAANREKLFDLIKEKNNGKTISLSYISHIASGKPASYDRINMIVKALDLPSCEVLFRPFDPAVVSPPEVAVPVLQPFNTMMATTPSEPRIIASEQNGHSAGRFPGGADGVHGRTSALTSTPAALVEYLYIDHRRLNSYNDQIMGTDRGQSLSWQPGPHHQNGEQSRSPTRHHEKILRLRSHLSETHQSLTIPSGVNAHFPRDTHPSASGLGLRLTSLGEAMEGTLFHEIEVSAVKLFVPGRNADPPLPGLTVWLSMPEFPFVIYFFQDSMNSDDLPEHHTFSSFTVWEMLHHAISGETNGWHNTDVQPWKMSDRTFPRTEPRDYLTGLGCVFSKPRRIKSLYRVRQFVNSSWGLHFFVYPIYIAESPLMADTAITHPSTDSTLCANIVRG